VLAVVTVTLVRKPSFEGELSEKADIAEELKYVGVPKVRVGDILISTGNVCAELNISVVASPYLNPTPPPLLMLPIE
jgi:hypothetical protein